MVFKGDRLLKTDRGFTLVEVMVACAILLMLLLPILSLFTAGTAAVIAGNKRTTAVNLAREKIETMKACCCRKTRNHREIEEEIPGYPGYRRSTEVVPVQMQVEGGQQGEPLRLELVEVEVNVYWTEREKEQKTNITTYLANR